ncbi:MAG: DUF4349 domain-containing protein [Proteobacteria bacterium]|nr:DUF4349 domain-containing protein [Pseudomonadota bacterium]
MHRAVVAVLVLFLSLTAVACAAGGARYAASPSAGFASPGAASSGSTAAAPADSTMAIPEQLVIEGSLTVQVEDIGDLVPALHALVTSMHGRVITEVVSGAETSWSAELKLRVPPDKVEEVVAFLAKRGEIQDKRINATDVSKQMFDQELAIKNLRTTLDRLTALMGGANLNVTQVLEIEKEMTRVRGQIDQLEGDQRFLKDRVGLATLDVSLSRRAGAVTVAKAKAYPGARFAVLSLFDPGTRERTRLGAGFVLHTVLRSMTLEVDLFRKEANAAGVDRKVAAVATLGGASYSDFLGKGERRTMNPYLGLRLGYGYLDSSRFVVQGEAGVELFKAKYFLIDASVRATGFFGKESDLALVSGLGAVIAF